MKRQSVQSLPKSDRVWIIPVALALLALAARAYFYFSVWSELWFRIPVVDAAYYNDWAQRIVAGDIFSRSEGVFLMNPGYPYFLAGIYSLLGNSASFVIFLQYLLGAAGCVAIYFISSILFEKRVAVMSGLIAATYGISIFYESMLLTASLINSLNLLALLSILLAVRKEKNHLLGVAGVLLGLSAVIRPNVLLFLPMVAVWMVWTNRRIEIRKILLLAVPVVLLLSPILLSNRSRGGAFTLTASSGINFYMGNNPAATGAHSKVRHISHETLLFKQESTKEASRRSGKQLSLVESSSFWFHEGLKFIMGHPMAYLRLLGRKCALFWNQYEMPANLSFYFARDRSALLRFLPGFGLVAVLGLAGIALAVTSVSSGVILLLLYALSTLASNLLIFVLAEYRYPIAAVLIIFTGYAVHGYWRLLQERRYRNFAMLFCVPLVVAPFIYRAVPYDKTQDPTYFNLAVAYSDQGDHDGAIRLLELDRQRKLEAGLPPDPTTIEHLGIEYFEKRDINRSLTYFDEAKSHNPADPRFWTNLGNVYLSLGKFSEAGQYYDRALANNPDYPDAYYWLGILNMNFGSQHKAVVQFEKSISLGYDTPEASYYNIGLLQLKVGKLGEAASAFERAVGIKPRNTRFLLALGDVYVQMNRCDAAFGQFDQAMKYDRDPATSAHIDAQKHYCMSSGRRAK